MKANEAPEKIYIQPRAIEELPHQNIVYTKPLADNSIEYSRTDAFIEKAVKFFEDKLTEKDCKFSYNVWSKVKSGETPIVTLMREFRLYMKEE